VEGSLNFMIILNFVDLLKELRRRITININQLNLCSGTNSRILREIIGLYGATE